MKNSFAIAFVSFTALCSVAYGQTATFQPNNAYRISNPSGYLDIGPVNTDYCHIQTDRTKFWFNKPLYINGYPSVAAYDINDFTIATYGTYAGFATRMTILSGSGYTGIGVAVPKTQLQVAGNITLGNSTAGQTWLLDTHILSSGDKFLIGYDDASGNMQYPFFIDRPTGNVAIGGVVNAVDPLSKLSVNGKIRAKEIRVETGWSDFVFAKTYKLPTLKSVEEYITQNGHLPEIPSSDDVSCNGVEVGQMESKLLQKVEELTLYMIELKKQNDALQLEVEKLKKK